MKAQGLPLNFIVLAALAVLILILAVGFVMGGSSSLGTAMSPTQAKTTCDNFCTQLNLNASAYEWSSTWSVPNAKYCLYNTTIKGQSTSVSCTSLTSCTVTFKDSTTCNIACDTSGTAKCA